MSERNETQSFPLEDGADELVVRSPQRAKRAAPDLEEIVGADPGGRMARMRVSAEQALKEFILLRDQTGVLKMALTHAPVYRALVRVSWAKRVERAADCGVSAGEVAEAMGLKVEAVRSPLRSLVRNRLARSKITHFGYQGTRALYYPTSRGEELLGIAEILGHGSLVQIGRPVNAWKGRNMSEPPNLFQIAHLITRGTAPETFQ